MEEEEGTSEKKSYGPGGFKFTAGNQYWRVRLNNGRPKIFDNPQQLADAANEYFEFIEQNPFKEQDFRGKDAYEVKINRMRPMTLEGLCNALEITKQTFLNYEKNPDFFDVTARIRQIIENNQFEGAAAGFLNPNIIARKLGLADKTDATIQLGATFEVEMQ